MSFISKWAGLLGLLAVLVVGDQIRINRPGHKFRLTVEVTTPDGIKAGSGVLAVVPDRNYNRGGRTTMRGEAVFVDLGQSKNLVALLAHRQDAKLDFDDINYVALRAYGAARGNRVSFNDIHRQTGVVPVQADLVPVLVSFGDPKDPKTARLVAGDHAEAVLGEGYAIRGITAEVEPNGFWPIDFGGVLGEPVTRGIDAKLPWLAAPGDPAATALQAAGLPAGGEAREAFARK
ncbi:MULTISPECIES: hypothetical protein [Bradyrhizobium]|uniref:Uncharacterized protein n=1 Tax=Bradyrhizobium ottawaense TaxID=931866 RepID=A0A2U8PE63_9BRAD|nr:MULTISPECIES: hypothetical protein [Bradyrhizobium]AWL95794.1 hypothetical protein CIT37_29365 [Bradyrhizobium ottawaense]MBR1330627.1 hypothetical protein [Bradyrhizobium ottawaense]MBR1337095.1 hypothetical protein [Bradyrhizobium ottawaense]MBR1366394.1 hypothetical protein [Bradyrhizobium ottawaense]MDA9448421.1 hypothetical protein [Bradyrhizobium sp. CCBAU 21360]